MVKITLVDVATHEMIEISERQLLAIATELFGGGNNVVQTTNALVWQSKVMFSRKVVEFNYRNRDFIIQAIETVERIT